MFFIIVFMLLVRGRICGRNKISGCTVEFSARTYNCTLAFWIATSKFLFFFLSTNCDASVNSKHLFPPNFERFFMNCNLVEKIATFEKSDCNPKICSFHLRARCDELGVRYVLSDLFGCVDVRVHVERFLDSFFRKRVYD